MGEIAQRVDARANVVYIGNMQHPEEWDGVGKTLRKLRESRAAESPNYSLRQVAARCNITPAYLSRVERGEVAPPGEDTLVRLATDLGTDPDVLLAMAGKVSADLRTAIMARPILFAELIRHIKTMPDQAVLRLVREVRDGAW